MVDLADEIAGGRYVPGFLLEAAERWLGLHALNVAHEHIDDDWDAGSKENFFRLACRYLNLNYDVEGLETYLPMGRASLSLTTRMACRTV